MKIKRPSTQQTEIVISVALKTTINGHLTHETIRDVEYMLGYHEINFDSVMQIIEETSDHVASTLPTLDDPTETDLDIIVDIVDHNQHAFHRIDLDVYMIELWENRREPIPSEKGDICIICCEEFGAGGEINSLNCRHSYHHHCILDWVKTKLACPCCREKLG
ncbi:hypothetical protein Bca4012_010415 [Brassica carinata]